MPLSSPAANSLHITQPHGPLHNVILENPKPKEVVQDEAGRQYGPLAKYEFSKDGKFEVFRTAGNGNAYAGYEANYLADVELLKQEVVQRLPENKQEHLSKISSFVRHLKSGALDENSYAMQAGPKLLREILINLENPEIPDDLKAFALDDLVSGIHTCSGGVISRFQTTHLTLQAKSYDLATLSKGIREEFAEEIVWHTLRDVRYISGDEIHYYNKVHNHIAETLNLEVVQDIFESVGDVKKDALHHAQFLASEALTPAVVVERLAQQKFERLVEILAKKELEPYFEGAAPHPSASPSLARDWISFDKVDGELQAELKRFFDAELGPLFNTSSLDLFYLSELNDDASAFNLGPAKDELRDRIAQGLVSASDKKNKPETKATNEAFDNAVAQSKMSSDAASGALILSLDQNTQAQSSTPPSAAPKDPPLAQFRLFERLAGKEGRAIVSIENMSFRTGKVGEGETVSDLQPITLKDLEPKKHKITLETSSFFRAEKIKSIRPDLAAWPPEVTHPLVMQAIENTKSIDDLMSFFNKTLKDEGRDDFFKNKELDAVLAVIRRSPDLQAQLIEVIEKPISGSQRKVAETRAQIFSFVDHLSVPIVTAKAILQGHSVSYRRIDELEAFALLPKEFAAKYSTSYLRGIAIQAIESNVPKAAIATLSAGGPLRIGNFLDHGTLLTHAISKQKPEVFGAMLKFIAAQDAHTQNELLDGNTFNKLLQTGKEYTSTLALDAAQLRAPDAYLHHLIDVGADLVDRDIDERTLLHMNCIADPEILEAILGSFQKYGVSKEEALEWVGDDNSTTPLLAQICTSWASNPERQFASVKNLLDAGADPLKLKGDHAYSMIQYASRYAGLETLKLLVETGEARDSTFMLSNIINDRTEDEEKDTLLSLVLQRTNASDEEIQTTVEYLLVNGADPNQVCDSGGMPPIFAAIELGNVGVTKLLLSSLHEKGYDIKELLDTLQVGGVTVWAYCDALNLPELKEEIEQHVHSLLNPQSVDDQQPLSPQDFIEEPALQV